MGHQSKTARLRCPLCNCSLENDTPFAFLSYEYLIQLQMVTTDSWDNLKFDKMPEYFSHENSVFNENNVSYDNHHDPVGHIKDLIYFLRDIMPTEICKDFDKKLYELNKIGKNGSANFAWYRGLNWRHASLHLRELLSSFFINKDIAKAFDALFEMLAEIHLFHYVNFDRAAEDFELIRVRYSALLFAYTLQLKETISADHIHKLFVFT